MLKAIDSNVLELRQEEEEIPFDFIAGFTNEIQNVHETHLLHVIYKPS